VENAEVDVALEELENRLERLRALYEQYFMGIERIEPAIPRKDVDRRIYVLRREKIRNTAKRFKLQTIISRYNTFQQYWQRICREIEAGTYKRHVIRAERIAPGQMLTIAARKRLGRAALDAARPDSAPPEAALPPSAQPEAALAAAPLPPATPAAAPLGAPRPGPPSVKPAAPPKPPTRPAKPNAPLEPARPKFESLDTMDLDFMNDWDPAATAGKPKRPPEVPARPFGRALTERLGASPPPPAVGALPARAKLAIHPVPPPAPRPPIVSGSHDAPTRAEQPPVAPRPPPPPPAQTGARPVAHEAGPAQTGVRPIAPARPPPPRAAAPPAGAPFGSAPTASPQQPPQTAALAPPKPPAIAAPKPAVAAKLPVPAPKPVAATPAREPVPAKPPAAATALAAPIAKPPVTKPTAPAAAPVADDRVRELHARLIEAKRQTKDAATVSMEGLARSMKATEAKLREQHKNRKIDFDVVIKDGKAVLKPIVR
jgi:hypothetical protein